MVPQRDHQPLQRGVRDGRLGLEAVRPEQPDPGPLGRGGLEQCGLADPRLALEQERAAEPVARATHHSGDPALLLVTTQQSGGGLHSADCSAVRVSRGEGPADYAAHVVRGHASSSDDAGTRSPTRGAPMTIAHAGASDCWPQPWSPPSRSPPRPAPRRRPPPRPPLPVDAGSARPVAPKPTIVLVHGAFADSSGWNDVATRLIREATR